MHIQERWIWLGLRACALTTVLHRRICRGNLSLSLASTFKWSDTMHGHSWETFHSCTHGAYLASVPQDRMETKDLTKTRESQLCRRLWHTASVPSLTASLWWDSLWGGADGLRPSLVATKGGWREGEDLPRLRLGHGSQEIHTTCRAWLYL